MKAAEIRDLGDGDLVERLDETRQELFNLRFQNVTGQLDNYARLKQVKRDIARLETELRTPRDRRRRSAGGRGPRRRRAPRTLTLPWKTTTPSPRLTRTWSRRTSDE